MPCGMFWEIPTPLVYICSFLQQHPYFFYLFFYHSCIYTTDIVIPLLSALASNMCVWQLQSRVFPSHYIKYIIIPKNL